ncbi:apolipoprotein N-acyltransferase [Kytococcus sp. Marseille-QA3725]
MVALLPRALAALVGGTLLWLSFPDADLWWAAAPGTALVTLAVRGARLLTGALLGLLAGLCLMVPLLPWSGVFLGVEAWLALAAFESVYFLPTGLALTAVQRWTARRTPVLEALTLPVLVAAVWVSQEWLRSSCPWGGFPWARLAFSQSHAPTLPVAQYLTATGLSAWVAGTGGLLAVAVLAARRRRWGSTAGAALATAALTVSPLLLPLQQPDGGEVDVLAVQGDAPQAGFQFDRRARVLTNHTSLVQQAAREVEAGTRPDPDVVLLPENAADTDPLSDVAASQQVAEASLAIDRPLLIGAIPHGPGGHPSNSVLQYLPGRGAVDRYDKQHLVPFGEWIPLRGLISRVTDKTDLVPRDFAEGTGAGTMDVPVDAAVDPAEELRLGLGICFEVAYDDLMRDPVRAGASMLFVPTNSASFGHGAQSTQQLAMSRVRAVEHARSVVQVSTMGVSAVIGPDGRTVPTHDGQTETGLFEPALLSATTPLNDGLTPAARLGNWPTWVLAALACLAGLAGVRTPPTPDGQREPTGHDGMIRTASGAEDR